MKDLTGGDFDDYETAEEKTMALIEYLCNLMAFKGKKVSEVDKKLFGRNYLPTCKHTGAIEFGRLLKYCDYLGVNIHKLMTFSYKNIAKKAEIEEKRAKIKKLRAELAKLEMTVKLDEKHLNDSYREENIKKARTNG